MYWFLLYVWWLIMNLGFRVLHNTAVEPSSPLVGTMYFFSVVSMTWSEARPLTPPPSTLIGWSQNSPECTVLHRSTCHTWELDTVGGDAFLTGDVCLVVLFSTGFFLVLFLFFCDFVSVAVEGVTGNFAGLEDWFEDLTKNQESCLVHSQGYIPK